MHRIIPFFVIHRGCPHRCIYCNEEKAAGDCPPEINESFFRERVAAYVNGAGNAGAPFEIAFYGGNFTGMDRPYQKKLLEMAAPFIKQGLAEGVRISTRPDYIDEGCLNFLQDHSVKTIEVGVQSMVDEVLLLSRRGHCADDVRRAMKLLRRRGFTTGVHLMPGLPGDNAERFAFTVEETVALRPDMVRIHPTLVLQGTELASAFAGGDYRPLGMEEAVSLCKLALKRFNAAGIPVIRVGLQGTPELEKPGVVIAGPFHPAFRALVEGEIFLDMASFLLSGVDTEGTGVSFCVAPRDASLFRGEKNRNIRLIEERFSLENLSLILDNAESRGALTLICGRDRKRITRQEYCR